MSLDLEKIKSAISELPKENQDELAAFLVHLRHLRDIENGRARTGDPNPSEWLTLDQLKEEWKE